jgi:hypothetical protein
MKREAAWFSLSSPNTAHAAKVRGPRGLANLVYFGVTVRVEFDPSALVAD